MFRILAIVLSLWYSSVSAHALLEHAEPAPGSVTVHAPAQIDLAFDSALEHAFCAVRLEDASGVVVEVGDIQHFPGEPNRLAVSVPALDAGTYLVRWSVVSRDGHQTEGDYRFTFK